MINAGDYDHVEPFARKSGYEKVPGRTLQALEAVQKKETITAEWAEGFLIQLGREMYAEEQIASVHALVMHRLDMKPNPVHYESAMLLLGKAPYANGKKAKTTKAKLKVSDDR